MIHKPCKWHSKAHVFWFMFYVFVLILNDLLAGSIINVQFFSSGERYWWLMLHYTAKCSLKWTLNQPSSCQCIFYMFIYVLILPVTWQGYFLPCDHFQLTAKLQCKQEVQWAGLQHTIWSVQQYPHVWSLDYQESLCGNFRYFSIWIALVHNFMHYASLRTWTTLVRSIHCFCVYMNPDKIDWLTDIWRCIYCRGAIFCQIHLSAGKIEQLLYFKITLFI